MIKNTIYTNSPCLLFSISLFLCIYMFLVNTARNVLPLSKDDGFHSPCEKKIADLKGMIVTKWCKLISIQCEKIAQIKR